MKRLIAVSVAVLGAFGVAHAGNIVNIGYAQGTGNYGIIGQAPTPSGTGNIPACSGYITGQSSTTAGANVVAGCASLPSYDYTQGLMSKITYDTNLFQKATLNGSPVPVPSASSAAPYTLTTSDGATFALMGGNTAVAANGSQTGTLNAWLTSNQLGTSTLYVPVGQYGVDTAYTMLNDILGSAVQVTFDFNTVNSLTGGSLDQVNVDLTDGLNIRSNVLCGTPGVSTGCNSAMYTTLTAGSAGTNVSATGLPIGTTINVSTGSYNVGAYNGIAAGAGQLDAGSSGTLTLDDQAYHFNSLFANDWLVGISVTELATNGPGGANTQAALSAVSVDVVAPEPTTMAMGLTGILIMIGVGVVRKKRTSV